MSSILAVCDNEAFGAMLKEGLDGMGLHEVMLTGGTSEALDLAARQKPDLVIVDVDLDRMNPAEFVQALRAGRPETRVMWMPFIGHPLSPALAAVDAQGALTKPFFIEELPRRIAAALQREVGQPFAHDDELIPGEDAEPDLGVAEPASSTPSPAHGAARTPPPAPGSLETAQPAGARRPPAPEPQRPPEPPPARERRVVLGGDRPSGIRLGGDRPRLSTPQPPSAPVSQAVTHPQPAPTPGAADESGDPHIAGRLRELAQALNADVALLTDREGRLIAWAGPGGRKRAMELAALVAAEAHEADRLAAFLGERGGRMESSSQQGERFSIFSFFLQPEDRVLSVAARADVPLGNLRHQVRQAAAEILPRSRYGPR